LTVIECPKCGSKFKIQKDVFARDTIKMRCSVCSHVFTYSPAEKSSLENDFDLLIGTNDSELQEKPLQDEITRSLNEDMPQEIAESGEGQETPQEVEPKEEDEVQPESVIREIDSILGSDQGVVSGDEDGQPELVTSRRMPLKAKVAIACTVIVLLGAGIFAAKVLLPSLNRQAAELETPVLERGPFFSIPDDSVTYEILTDKSGGALLVIKGVIKKLTSKPLKSVLVEARVYDPAGALMESRSTYAGVVPKSSELMQKSSDIDLLLTAEPRTLGVLETSPDIPFVVFFFGKPAREGTSFKVEVKEFHWK